MRRMVLAAITGAALVGCQPAPPEFEDAWVRLPAVPGRPAAGYFTAEGGQRDEVLVAVRTAAAGRVELHESIPGGMRAVRQVPLPNGKDVVFKPGGLHLMLFDVAPTVRPGDTVTFDFDLGDGGGTPVEAKVVGAADPAP